MFSSLRFSYRKTTSNWFSVLLRIFFQMFVVRSLLMATHTTIRDLRPYTPQALLFVSPWLNFPRNGRDWNCTDTSEERMNPSAGPFDDWHAITSRMWCTSVQCRPHLTALLCSLISLINCGTRCTYARIKAVLAFKIGHARKKGGGLCMPGNEECGTYYWSDACRVPTTTQLEFSSAVVITLLLFGWGFLLLSHSRAEAPLPSGRKFLEFFVLKYF